MTVDPRHFDPLAMSAGQAPAPGPGPGAVDPAATQPERDYPTAEYPAPAYPAAPYTGAPYTGSPYTGAAWPGTPRAAMPHARMLAASADRERAVDVLKAGFAEGRLTQGEYNDRVSQAYAARTYGELESVVGDLPAGPLGGPARYQGGGYPVPRAVPSNNSMAVASLVCGLGVFFTMGLTAIPAIILGHMARRQMRETGESGDGLAIAGLFLGWAGIGLIVAFIAGMVAVASSMQLPVIPPGGPLQGP